MPFRLLKFSEIFYWILKIFFTVFILFSKILVCYSTLCLQKRPQTFFGKKQAEPTLISIIFFKYNVIFI